MYELTPVLKQSFVDSNGLPLSGGLLYSYAAGTSTPLATYTDSTGLTPNTNPVVLDSAGRANVWMGANSYKFVLEDANSNIIFTEDNILSISAQVAAAADSVFQSVNMSYTQFQTGSTSNAVAAFSIPAGSILKNVIVKHSTAFAGTSITAVEAQVGRSGSYSEVIGDFDVFQGVADAAYDNAVVGIPSFTSPSVIYVNLVSVGANLSALSAGALTVYYEYQKFM